MTSLTVNAIRRQAAKIFSSVATPLFQDLLPLESCGRFSGLHLEAGERHIDAISFDCQNGGDWEADYVRPSYSEAYEGCLTIVEAKKQIAFPGGLAQAASYMVGIQQQRMRLGRIVATVYGMVSDVIRWPPN
jgi:hypothetical protein